MTDSFVWLEEIHSNKSLAFVRAQNEISQNYADSLADYRVFQKRAQEILQNKDKIPTFQMVGPYLYGLWSDNEHIQGLYRRIKTEDFLKGLQEWENLIDLDLLSKLENQKWVYAGISFSPAETKALVFLSPGGTDANIIREFDLVEKQFIKDGFELPLSKGSACYLNEDQILAARVFENERQTFSGYPIEVRKYSRADTEHEIIFEGQESDVNVWVMARGGSFALIQRTIDFYHSQRFLYHQNGELGPLQISEASTVMDFNDSLIVLELKEDEQRFKASSLVAYDPQSDEVSLIFEPRINEAIEEVRITRDGLLMILSRDVSSTLYSLKKVKGAWVASELKSVPNSSMQSLTTYPESLDAFVNTWSFNQPQALVHVKADDLESDIIKTLGSYFTHEQIVVAQNFAVSADGTRVPYFLVHHQDVVYDGNNPTILYGYGGFEISMLPYFDNSLGSLWLERKGVFVLSNIRGGGEYGPAWHQSALKENRGRAYEDFFAIAEDLIRLKVTSSNHLGAQGGSNGGLLMGVCMTMRPDLFRAIHCAVPLLDMRRYHHLLAGNSWVAEYGDPDKAEGAYIHRISPYHNLRAGAHYPSILLTTSTKDDRVHPGHARKFHAKLTELGAHSLYYENIEGGHAGSSDALERSHLLAMVYAFFWDQLK